MGSQWEMKTMEITRLNAGLCAFMASPLKLESAEVGFVTILPQIHTGFCALAAWGSSRLMEKLRAPGGLTCTNGQPEPCLQALPQEEPATTGPLHALAHQTPRSTSPL